MAPNSTLYPFLELEVGSVPPSLNFPQLDFVKPSSGFHPVTWERVKKNPKNDDSPIFLALEVIPLAREVNPEACWVKAWIASLFELSHL